MQQLHAKKLVLIYVYLGSSFQMEITLDTQDPRRLYFVEGKGEVILVIDVKA